MYYDPTNLEDVKKEIEEYKRNGFHVDFQIHKVTITREINKYNKYLKWRTATDLNGIGHSYNWYKTRPEAIRKLSQPCRPLPTGNNTFIFHFTEILKGTP